MGWSPVNNWIVTLINPGTSLIPSPEPELIVLDRPIKLKMNSSLISHTETVSMDFGVSEGTEEMVTPNNKQVE